MDQRNGDTSEPDSFAYCYQPIYYFARVCGQMPFTIFYPISGAIVEVKLNKRDFVWMAISLSVQITFICMAINFYRSYQHAKLITSTIYFGNLTIWFVSVLFGVSIMALDACNRFRIVKILNKITIFDVEVSY